MNHTLTTSNTIELKNKGTNVHALLLEGALNLIEGGFNVVPFCGKAPNKKIKSTNKLHDRPLNGFNIGNFVDDTCTAIGVLLEKNLNCIDVDSKYDLTAKLFNDLITIIKFTLPDVYDKLVICKSPNGGYHIYFVCTQSGAKEVLAARPATPEEQRGGKTQRPLIEQLGTGMYVPGPPSPGYELIKGEFESFESFEYITPEERKELIGICKSFDQLKEICIKDISKREAKRENAPWKVFNDAHDWEWMRNELTQRGYEIVNENEDWVIIVRPGSLQRSSGKLFKESNILYLFSTSTEFPYEEPITAFGMKSALEFDGNWRECAKHLSEQGYGSYNTEISKFYALDERNKIDINLIGVVEWVADVEILKHWTSDNDYNIVQVAGNVIRQIPLDTIKKNFLENIEEIASAKIYNYFIKQVGNIFQPTGGVISKMGNLDDSKLLLPRRDAAYLFFSNGALQITNEGRELIPFEKLNGYIWERQIIKRQYTPCPYEGDFYQFVLLIAGADNFNSFCSAIGYLLHQFKDPAFPKVVILTDAAYDQNDTEPSGGTGKGLLIQAIAKLVTCYILDGKRIDLSKQFVWQGIGHDTRIAVIEDIKKGADLEPMFSTITDGMTIEKKHKNEMHIPYAQSPKLLITSNYAIKGTSSSHTRRRFELELQSTFSDKYTPLDRFGHRFFDDWDSDEWSRFDNFMIHCLELYLQSGLIVPNNINLLRKRLIQDTHRDFVQWMGIMAEENKIPVKITKDDLKKQFVTMFPDHEKKTLEMFTKWLARWCKEMGLILDASNKYNGVMAYHIRGDISRAYQNWRLVNDPVTFVNQSQDADEVENIEYEEAPF